MRLTALGLLRPALGFSWLVVFALVLGEVELAGFLAQPGRQPISVFLDNLMHYGRSASVARWTMVVVATEVCLAWTVLAIGVKEWQRLRVKL
jgi:ABC-type Fe3+ transport system permease subunit